MIQKTDDLLQRMGYQYYALTSKAGLWYIMEEGIARVVLRMELTSEMTLSTEQLQEVQQKARELFLHPQGRIAGCEYNMVIYDVRMLTLLVTTQPDMARELCSSCRNVWMMDEVSQRLVIYENQPGTFYGLEMRLPELWESADKPVWSTVDRTAGRRVLPVERFRNLSVVNLAIIAINVCVFVVLFLMGDTESGAFISEHGGMYPPYVIENGEWWRIFTSMFLHFGIDHLANNMIVLLCVGDVLERTVGRVRYLIIYLVSGLCGGVLSLAMMVRMEDTAVSAGASGAIFGVIGAVLWIAIRNRGRLETFTARRLLLMILLSLYLGFTGSGVDNWCHVGGLLGGFMLSVLLYQRKNRQI